MSGEDRNTKLMKQMGSPTGKWNPEAPDQNLFVLNKGNEAILVVAAWVKAHTSERIPGSPFCVDEKGRSVYIKKLAKDLHWELQTARNELVQAEAAGLCRVEKGRIWQCADIPLAHQKRSENRRTKREKSNSVQSYFSGQVLDSIENLSDEKRNWLEARFREYLKWRPTLFSDGMAALRDMDERMKNNILRGVGIEKKPSAKERKNARKPVTAQLTFDLVVQPNFVQSYSEDASVQSMESASVQSKNGGPTFSVFRPLQQQTTTTANGEAHAPLDDVVVVGEKLKAYGTISKPAQQKFLDSCRKASPECTAEQICAVIDGIAKGFNRNTRHPMGVLIREVPGNIAEYRMASKPKSDAASPERNIEALRWLAANDPEPAARQQAEAELERLLPGTNGRFQPEHHKV